VATRRGGAAAADVSHGSLVLDGLHGGRAAGALLAAADEWQPVIRAAETHLMMCSARRDDDFHPPAARQPEVRAPRTDGVSRGKGVAGARTRYAASFLWLLATASPRRAAPIRARDRLFMRRRRAFVVCLLIA
jgi:hypothetical protein